MSRFLRYSNLRNSSACVLAAAMVIVGAQGAYGTVDMASDQGTSGSSVTLQGESMTKISGKVKRISSPRASGGLAVAVSRAGAVSKSTSISGVDEISIRARKASCRADSRMTLFIDGKQKKTWKVSKTSYKTYSAGLSLSGANHKVSVRHSADGSCSQLVLDKIVLKSAGDIAVEAPPVEETPETRDAGVIAPNCTRTLQSMIDGAAPGSTLSVPGGCIYREAVKVTKPLTIEAGEGAEIRGSDIWTGWASQGDNWVSETTLPTFNAGYNVVCTKGTQRCLWPEQVFMNGGPLKQVDSDPAAGEFSVNSNRNVVLGSNPADRLVEVTTRRTWLVGRSPDVTVRGFTMKHAASERGIGAINNRDDRGGNYHSNWTIEGNTLSDAAANVLRVNGKNIKVLDNDISRGGQLGISGDGEQILVSGNKIHNNNTELFDPSWEAGGAKFAADVRNITVKNNDIYQNQAVGFWCDIDCNGANIDGNRFYSNWGPGLLYEISANARITNNSVWDNGWKDFRVGRAWSPGIKVENSTDVHVSGNVLAWNASGLAVVQRTRSEARWNSMKNVHVLNNTFIAMDGRSLSFMYDTTASRALTDTASNNNYGANNRYWYPSTDKTSDRFRWSEIYTRDIKTFNNTRGEENGYYMSTQTKDSVLSSERMAGVPTAR